MVAKFAVIVATYHRSDGSTLNHLKRLSTALANQTYQDFHIFLIGDDYQPNEEFEQAVEYFPSDQISYENNKASFRKGTFNIAKNRWTSGGMLARHMGIVKAIQWGCEYYAHIDDDDTWSSNHLEWLNNTLEDFPEADFLYTRSKYENIYLPRDNISQISYNNVLPTPINIVHSSTCLKLSTLGSILLQLFDDRFARIDEFRAHQTPEVLLEPFDIIKWRKFTQLANRNTIKCVYIPKVTCYKLTDRNIPG